MENGFPFASEFAKHSIPLAPPLVKYSRPPPNAPIVRSESWFILLVSSTHTSKGTKHTVFCVGQHSRKKGAGLLS